MFNQIKIFTDGSCLGNPGPGGYSTILQYKKYEKILTAGFHFTTNNRMELMAVIAGLESLKKSCSIIITTDSKYVKTGVQLWMPKWKTNKWNTIKKKPVKNIDLWLRLDCSLHNHYIQWIWIKGHSGHIENERCNILAKKSAQKPYFKDINYQKT